MFVINIENQRKMKVKRSKRSITPILKVGTWYRETCLVFSRTPIAAKKFIEGLIPNQIIAFENGVISASTELLDKLF